MPPGDESRRKEEFVRFAQSMRGEGVPLPPNSEIGNYVWCACYVVLDESADIQVTADVLPCHSYLDEFIDEFPEGRNVSMSLRHQPVEISGFLLTDFLGLGSFLGVG